MKINWKRKYTIAIVAIDGILIILFILLIDVFKLIEFSFLMSILANVFIGVLTIMGGFGLAYWIIEKDAIKKEQERIKIVNEALLYIKQQLLPWLYDYAFRLSPGYESIQKFRKIITVGHDVSDSEFEADKPLFEDVFGIIRYDSQGNNLTGTRTEFSIIDSYTIDAQYLHGVLLTNRAGRMVRKIKYAIEETPDFRNYVNRKTAKIKHIDDLIEDRLKELESWEKNHDDSQIKSTSENMSIRHNLRSLGAEVFNILLSINQDIDSLSR